MQMKATEQNFPVVLSIMRNNSNLNFLLLGDKGLELNATMKVTTLTIPEIIIQKPGLMKLNLS